MGLNIIPSWIKRATIKLLFKVSRFFHDLQVNALLTKKYIYIFVIKEFT